MGISLFGGGLFAGGLAIGMFVGAVPMGFVLLGFMLRGSHGAATVAKPPLGDGPPGRDALPDATVGLEAVLVLLVLEPALPVEEDVLPGEVELAERPVPAALLVEGVHGATVVVVAD